MENTLGYYIGNDIVAFPKQEKPKYQNQRWLNKVFTTDEQVFILNSNNPEQTLWWFWSCKESAYKVFIKIENIRQFNPKSIKIITIDKPLKQTKIKYKSWSVWTASFFHSTYIHTKATNVFNILPLIKCQVFQYKDCSKQAGSFLLKSAFIEHLKTQFLVPQNIVLTKKKYNIPYCVVNNTFKIEVSFSDDLFFFSFCYYFND